ncbi:transposase [Paenibacillus larvae]|nr:transposase [Paenibacillus larvae]
MEIDSRSYWLKYAIRIAGLLWQWKLWPDHVHLFLNGLPTDSPSDVMAKVKGVTLEY